MIEQVGIRFFLRLAVILGKQRDRLLARFVHGHDFKGAACGNRGQVGGDIFVGAVGDLTVEHVVLEEEVCGIGGFEAHILARQMLEGFNVDVDLEVQTAFQFRALSGQFLRVERDVLKTCGGCAYRHEVGHPACATQRTAAGTDAAYAACLLARANLFHLNAHLECVGQHFDELTEVNALIGNVVEYRFVAIALIFNVADFHVELEVFGNLSGANHRVVFLGLCLLEAVEVGRLGLAEHALDFGVTLDVCFAHLTRHEHAGERHLAYVVARSSFNGHCITDFKR